MKVDDSLITINGNQHFIEVQRAYGANEGWKDSCSRNLELIPVVW